MANAPAYHVRGRILPSEEERDVYVVDGRFTFERPSRSETLRGDGWLLPGLVDAHAHLGLNSPVRGSPDEQVRGSARAHLDAGVLLIREPGGPDRASATIRVEEGLPRVQSAGRFLAPPNGYFPGLAREIEPAKLAAAVTEEAKASRAWVKLVGDFVGRDGKLSTNWTPEALRAAAKAAHEANARITIHAMHPDTVRNAIEARFDGIEHGHAMTLEGVEAMKKANVAWCPTMIIAPMVPKALGSMMSSAGRAELAKSTAALPKMVAQAARSGVTLLAGTDAAMTPHGVVRQEVAQLLDAGVPPDAALAAASWAARKYLGHPGIEEGAPADLVVFEKDPRGSADGLRQPALIVLDGRVVGKAAVASRPGIR